jgi:integrase
MVYVAVYTGLRVSELAALRWNDIPEASISIDERFCRGDWGEPKSEASCATIAVNCAVIERIHRLKLLTVKVRAGRAVRKYRVVKSDAPDALVFQSVKDTAVQCVTTTSSPVSSSPRRARWEAVIAELQKTVQRIGGAIRLFAV